MLRVLFPCLALAAIIIAGCGGGGGGSFIAAPTPAPTAQTTTAPLSASSTTLVSFGSVSNGSGAVAITSATVTLPQTSAATTATLKMQATLPTGTLAPALRELRGRNTIGGTNLKPLAYFVFSVSSTVTISSWPGFTVVFPGMPITGTAYVAVRDTSNPSNTWNIISAPLSANSSILTFPANTFAPPAAPLTLTQGVIYDYVILTGTSVPSPSPLPSPTAMPTAAYCSAFSSPLPAGVTLNLTDDSGLSGAVLVVYIENGTDYMDNTGSFSRSTAYAIPAACFSTTLTAGAASAGATQALRIPSGVSGRVYLAYATPNPNPSIIPNPFGTVNISGPNVGYASNPFPWDKIEYGSFATAVIDTTQVDALGLPLELSVSGGALPSVHRRTSASTSPAPCATSAAGIVGVTSCNFATIFQAMSAIPQYNQLVVTQSFNSKLIDMQIVAPKDSVAFTSFQWNLMALASYIPAPQPAICTSAPTTYGYLSCVLASYSPTPAPTSSPFQLGRLFQTSGIGAAGVSGDNYCAISDGVSNFIFTDVGSATTCAGATAKTPPSPMINGFSMPVREFTYGVAQPTPTPVAPATAAPAGCTQAILFSQPWGNANVGSGQLFAAPDAFALWKGLTADLNRGTMLTTSTHPVGVSTPPPVTLNTFFQDPMFNTYAQVIHTYFDGNLAYALAYDDLGSFESGVELQANDSINVRINAIPTASSASVVPVPTSVPSSCPALPLNVGTF